MKKVTAVSLVVVIIALVVFIFGKPNSSDGTPQNDTTPRTESVAEPAPGTVTEPITETTSTPTAEKPMEATPKVTTAPATKMTEAKTKATTKATTKSTTVTTAKEAAEHDYVLNTNTMKFHYPDCKSVKDIKDKNREDYHGTKEKLIDRGFSPCGRCKP